MRPIDRTLLASLAGTLLAACAAAPERLDPGPGVRALATVAARGVQIYECRVSAAPATDAAWTFVAPEAELFDAAGRPVGSHGAGPHWAASDGSRVVGQLVARHDVPDAIPWLLLRTHSTGGPGAWAGVVAIQRIHTEGGQAPAAATQACDASRAGQRIHVPYRAAYRLFATA